MPDLTRYFFGTGKIGPDWDKEGAFALFDGIYQAGVRGFECAPNYPLCDNPEYFRQVEAWLIEWIDLRGVDDLEVMMKIGAINNQPNFQVNSLYSFLLMSHDDYRFLFKGQLKYFMVQKYAYQAVSKDALALISRKTGIGFENPLGIMDIYENFKGLKESIYFTVQPSAFINMGQVPSACLILETTVYNYKQADNIALSSEYQKIDKFVAHARSITEFQDIIHHLDALFVQPA